MVRSVSEQKRVFDGSESDRERELNEFDETKGGVRGLIEGGGVTKLPRIFILPPQHRNMGDNTNTEFRVPIVDLEEGFGMIGEIRKASETWGIFQVINHGVPHDVVSAMLESTLRFHEQPKESKLKFYTRDATNTVAYRTTIHPILKTTLWKDTLACMFQGDNHPNPQIPFICREAMHKYAKHMTALKNTLSRLLSQALGLSSDHLEKSGCMEAHKLAAHYYPTCPEPNLTLGSPKHADPYFLTIISQNIDGLQALHEDQWVDVLPIQGALVIIIGDMLQMMSNDLFKSAEHRAVPRGVGTRVSAACFFYPTRINKDRKYGVIDELVTEINPPVYRKISQAEYLKCFGANGIVGSKALPHFKII